MAYLMTPTQAAINLNLRTEQAPVGNRVSPVQYCKGGNRWDTLAMGIEVSFPGIPPQAHGLRFIRSPIGGGTTICLIGPKSHYAGLDNVGTAIADVLRGSRTIRDIKYVAPVGKDGQKNSDYQKWGRRHYKMLEDNTAHWNADYTFKESAPFHKIWVFYRLGQAETMSHGFMCLGNWFTTNVDRGGEALHLRSIPRPAGAPAPDLNALAGVASRIFNAIGSPLPAIVAAWASPAPVRGRSAPALIPGGSGGEIARPAASRAADNPSAAMDILAGVAGAASREDEETRDIDNQLVQFTIQDLDDPDDPANEQPPNQYGSMHSFSLPINQGHDELAQAPVVRSEKGKEKAVERPRSPYQKNRGASRGYVPAGDAESSDSDEDETPLMRAKPPTKKRRTE